jgi:hypothetical protein
MKATNTALLPLKQLKVGVRKAAAIPEMSTQALMSIRQLADQGYTTIFHPYHQGATAHDNDSFQLVINKRPLLQGWRDKGGLWTVPLATKKAMDVYELPLTKVVIQFQHAALGFPTKASLLNAICHKNLVTLPGMLTANNVNKFFPESNETQKEHMRQSRQGVRLTKVIDKDPMLEAETHPKPTPGVKIKDVYLRVFDATKKAMYTNQPGRLPIASTSGHKYTMVEVKLYGNHIDAEPMKSRSAKELTKAYKRIYARWKATGVICPNWHILHNKAPAEFLEAIWANGCRVEKTPAEMHRRNITECAIQTYKGHFIATLAGVSDNFPIHQWQELVPQIVLTLNLLRLSHVAPNVSAYAYHHGNFGYNRMPLAPMGCAVQFHIKPNIRRSWGEHSSDSWYLTMSLDHYRCHFIFVKATRAKQISNTVYFKHKHITQPTLTTEDLVIKAIQDLSNAIKGGRDLGGNTQIKAIKGLTNVLRPGNQLPLQAHSPRVQIKAPPRVQFDAPPRVQFNIGGNDEIPFDVESPHQLIVKSFTASTQQQQPKTILN